MNRHESALAAIIARDDAQVAMDLVRLIDAQVHDPTADPLILELSRCWFSALLSRYWSPIGAPTHQSLDAIEKVVARLDRRKPRRRVN